MSPAPIGDIALWLSVRPQYANQIVCGSKNVELRRVRPRVEPGSLVIVYATTPIKAIVGLFLLENVEEALPPNLWERVDGACGIDLETYRQYFLNSRRAVGLHVGTRWTLESPVNLKSIRTVWPGFMPPQSFRYVKWTQQCKSIALTIPKHSLVPLMITPVT